MDNLAHTLVGIALSRLRFLTRSPLATPALLLGANLPDSDVVMRVLYGTAGYLEYHRGITHALFGMFVQSLLIAFVLHRIERRRWPERCARHFLAWNGPWLPSAVGLASHFVLDYAISYGIRPWLPFSGRWFYGDLVFVVDPWLWLLFGALAVGKAHSRGLDLFLAGSALFACAVVVISPVHHLAWGVRVGVPCGALLLGWSRAQSGQPRVASAVTTGALLLLCAYLATLGLARHAALEKGRAWLESDAARALSLRPKQGNALLPLPGDPFAWAWIVASENDWIRVPIHALDGVGVPVATPRARESAELDLALAEPAGRAWHEFARFPTELRVTRDGALVLVLSDARYWYTDFCTVEVELSR